SLRPCCCRCYWRIQVLIRHLGRDSEPCKQNGIPRGPGPHPRKRRLCGCTWWFRQLRGTRRCRSEGPRTSADLVCKIVSFGIPVPTPALLQPLRKSSLLCCSTRELFRGVSGLFRRRE